MKTEEKKEEEPKKEEEEHKKEEQKMEEPKEENYPPMFPPFLYPRLIKGKTAEEKLKEKQELINELKNENENLKNEINNKNMEYNKCIEELNKLKNTIRFKGNKVDEKESYDIIIDINSIFSLNSSGWLIKYPKGKEEYERKIKRDTIIVGVIGNRNSGKSFILQKLSGYNIPQGFFTITEGLSIKYGEEEDHCIAILDTAGKEGPLLNQKKPILEDIDNEVEEEEDSESILENNNNIINYKNDNNIKENDYEVCLRDKLITETFIQSFIIETSHILILVVGNINLNEQKLLQNIKNSINPHQYLFVIHNLRESHSEEEVEGYIEGKLKNLFGIKLKEKNFFDNEGNYHKKFYTEENNENITHLIYVNEYNSISNYYNLPALKLLKNKINSELNRKKFSVIEACKDYFEKIEEKFIEEKITKNNFDNSIDDKIILKNKQKITLKRIFIDEIGQTIINNFGQTNYSYYTTKDDLIIKVELPGENSDLKTKLDKGQEFYTFYFEGIKEYDESVIKEEHKIKENLKSSSKIFFKIFISTNDITIGNNKNGKLNYYEKEKKYGIFIFKYHLINSNNSNDYE